MVRTSKDGILFMFHCIPNTGYAILSLEEVFCQTSLQMYSPENIHFSYKPSSSSISHVSNCGVRKKIVLFNLESPSPKELSKIKAYVRDNKIKTVVCFDQGPEKKLYMYLRTGGVRTVIAYWGAPISKINNFLVLMLKKIEVILYRYQPDFYIFESQAMANTALLGRGISKKRIKVINLGVDVNKFFPLQNNEKDFYAHDLFSIPKDQRIIFYSGHMEKRKGVAVIVKAAIQLIDKMKYQNVHFLLLGNQPGEEKQFHKLLVDCKAENHVTFGGYREDIAEIHKSCEIGVIASTGWDSFTMSAVEMAASGLPLIVSQLQGLCEVIAEDRTGLYIKPGDYVDLALKISRLLEDQTLRKMMSEEARRHAIHNFSKDRQVKLLAGFFRRT